MLKKKVDIFTIFSFDSFLQQNDVWVPELEQKHNLTIDSLCVSWICESIEVFLQCFYFIVLLILNSEYMPIGSASQFFNNFESGQQVGFNLFCHFYYLIYLRFNIV